MAKLKEDPITEADIVGYLDSVSDFAFELRCLKQLVELGYKCEHGGTYSDPVTKKRRQFDIRAGMALDGKVICDVHLAVECKNLRDYNPLVVMTVPRTAAESSHQLLMSFPPEPPGPPPYAAVEEFTYQVLQAGGSRSAYQLGDPVGKSCDQIAVRTDGTPSANDGEVYDKWAQALASADDLAENSTSAGAAIGQTVFTLVLPVLVVPARTLWQVDYSDDGKRLSPPRQVDRVPFYVGHELQVGWPRRCSLQLTHLEFVTPKGLCDLVENMLLPGGIWFPSHVLSTSPSSVNPEDED